MSFREATEHTFEQLSVMSDAMKKRDSDRLKLEACAMRMAFAGDSREFGAFLDSL